MGSELVSRSAMDSKLLSLARKSPAEIAELTGLDARFVASRISELLESRDWLSDRQQERLLLEEVAELKDMAFDAVRSSGDAGEFAATANVALRTLKLVSERIDARRKLVESDIAEITAAQARVFGKAFDRALNYIVNKVKESEELPDDEVVDAWVADGLRLAVRELDGHVVSE
jgi:hypothetical protein